MSSTEASSEETSLADGRRSTADNQPPTTSEEMNTFRQQEEEVDEIKPRSSKDEGITETNAAAAAAATVDTTTATTVATTSSHSDGVDAETTDLHQIVVNIPPTTQDTNVHNGKIEGRHASFAPVIDVEYNETTTATPQHHHNNEVDSCASSSEDGNNQHHHPHSRDALGHFSMSMDNLSTAGTDVDSTAPALGTEAPAPGLNRFAMEEDENEFAEAKHIESNPHKRRFMKLLSFLFLTINSLGVIYGDIGTSPLYVVHTIFADNNVHPENIDNILGSLSLIIYAITTVVTVKYILYILNADSNGEGGVFALVSLMPKDPKKMHPLARKIFVVIAIIGASLLLGDGIITPAISILSAVEGLETTGSETMAKAVVPITCIILIVLFLVQRFGTAKVGLLFGPIMLLWFSSIAIIGIYHIVQEPSAFRAFNPKYAYLFFHNNKVQGWMALGSVVLCITGVEALYADLGHFGKGPIRVSWLLVVYPALLLNYIGQCALLIRDPSKISNPFYESVPKPVYWPMVVLATVATIIASQAMISGAFSLVSAAVSMKYFPRVRVLHTSKKVAGQIYIPEINWLFMCLTLILVLAFRSSAKLASAYGVAVTGDMVLTTFLFSVVLYTRYRIPFLVIIAFILPIFFVDCCFATATSIKIATGGWVALIFCGFFALIMLVFHFGNSTKVRAELMSSENGVSIIHVEDQIAKGVYTRQDETKGVGIFLTPTPVTNPSGFVPSVFTKFIQRAHVVPHTVLFLTVRFHEHLPFIRKEKRIKFKDIGNGFYQLTANYGYVGRKISVQEILDQAEQDYGFRLKDRELTFYIGRTTVVPSKKKHWFFTRFFLHLYRFMVANSRSPQQVFNIEPDLVIEVGTKCVV